MTPTREVHMPAKQTKRTTKATKAKAKVEEVVEEVAAAPEPEAEVAP
jgi:hypothetical protein